MQGVGGGWGNVDMSRSGSYWTLVMVWEVYDSSLILLSFTLVLSLQSVVVLSGVVWLV